MSDTATRLPDRHRRALANVRSRHRRSAGSSCRNRHLRVFAGGHFLVHHVDVTVGGQPVRERSRSTASPTAKAGTWVVAMTATVTSKSCICTLTMTACSTSLAAARLRRLPNRERPTARVRSTLTTVARDQASMAARWERSEDGTTWQPWMDMPTRDE